MKTMNTLKYEDFFFQCYRLKSKKEPRTSTDRNNTSTGVGI